MSRILGALACVVMSAAAAQARPVATYVPRTPTPDMSPAVSSNVIFLDRCASGCTITRTGTDDSRTDRSTIGGGTLAAFNCGDTAWQAVMTCMKDVFRDYNVVITDVDPGSADHLEIKVAGTSANIGLGPDVGGIAPFYCQSYQQDALVFDFANEFGCATDEICAVAAQEIAHTWSLDHVVDASDPMTYFGYSGRRFYHDGVQCGSDCTNSAGQLCMAGTAGCHAPFNGATCTTAQTHPCYCDNASTQDDNMTVLNLFGPGNPTPPTVTIDKPKDGDALAPGFAVQAEVMSNYGVSKVELYVDGNLVSTITSMPYVFNAPQTLQPGQHSVEVDGYDSHSLAGKMSINIIIGAPCTKAADCPDSTETCIGGRCVPGSGVPGGLGSPCKLPSDCLEGECASDGTNMYCTSDCTPGQCPSGFGCLPSGAGSGSSANAGVCWPGYNDGSGGGGCSTQDGAPLGLAGLMLGLVLSRRRPRRR